MGDRGDMGEPLVMPSSDASALYVSPGAMEAFFRKVTQANAMPPQDPELWRAHGMELLGPPRAV